MPTIFWIFLMVIVYLAAELCCILITGQTFIAKCIKEILHIILHSFKEVTSEKGEEKFCGAIVIMAIIATIILIAFGFHCAITNPDDLQKVIMTVGCCFFSILMIIVFYQINRKYIVRK